MTQQEQQHLKQKSYAEAMRYMANAKDYLKTAGKDERDESHYKDKKYVRTACGTAYNGVLEALTTYLRLKNPSAFETNERKTIDFYRRHLAKDNKKILNALESAYRTLHISGYYEGEEDSKIIKHGFQRAKEIINLIKPVGAAQ